MILFIDSYAVSVGSIHGCKNKCKKIDFKLLEKIHNEVDKPLVIHGSSGVVDDDLKVLYQYGVVKVNIETELRMIYKKAIKQLATLEEIRPRILVEEMKIDIIEYIKYKYNILDSYNVCDR